jgi:hypothetical protein
VVFSLPSPGLKERFIYQQRTPIFRLGSLGCSSKYFLSFLASTL